MMAATRAPFTRLSLFHPHATLKTHYSSTGAALESASEAEAGEGASPLGGGALLRTGGCSFSRRFSTSKSLVAVSTGLAAPKGLLFVVCAGAAGASATVRLVN